MSWKYAICEACNFWQQTIKTTDNTSLLSHPENFTSNLEEEAKVQGNTSLTKDISIIFKEEASAESFSPQKWSQPEDCVLLSLVETYGEDWDTISRHMSNRKQAEIFNRYKEITESDKSNNENLVDLERKLNKLQEVYALTEDQLIKLENSLNSN